MRLHAATNGLFDVAVAPSLVRWGFIPVQGADLAGGGSAADISLLDGYRVRFGRPLQIDLGGIAKGYAVDRAVAALKRAGVPAGVVNAGGDLRVFGAQPRTIHIRRPDRPNESLPLLEVANAAVATSGAYFASRSYRGGLVSPIVDPVTGESCRDARSVTVIASNCALADALTKVLLLNGGAAASVLRRSCAAAVTITPDGRVCRYGRGQAA
jgi:thiamine biosynthesis lipoprotein